MRAPDKTRTTMVPNRTRSDSSRRPMRSCISGIVRPLIGAGGVALPLGSSLSTSAGPSQCQILTAACRHRGNRNEFVRERFIRYLFERAESLGGKGFLSEIRELKVEKRHLL